MTTVGHEQQHRAILADAHGGSVVAIGDEGTVVAHVLQRIVPNQQRTGSHDVRVGECLLPTACRSSLQDEDAVAMEAECAVLVVFAVHGVLARRVLAQFHTINAQVADWKVLVHIKKGAVDRRHRIVLQCHLGSFRAARLVRERQRIVRRIRDFQYENLLVRGEQLLLFEPALFQYHSVQGVDSPVAVHER